MPIHLYAVSEGGAKTCLLSSCILSAMRNSMVAFAGAMMYMWLSVQGPPARMVQALASPPSAQAPAALRAQSGQAQPAALPHREPLAASAHTRNPSSAAEGGNMPLEDIETGSAGAASLSSSPQDAPADSSSRGVPLL